MNQEDKQLLLKDLCARLPYRVICEASDKHLQRTYELTSTSPYGCGFNNNGGFYGFESFSIKPYLRPMSSMTEEETKELDAMSTGVDVLLPNGEGLTWIPNVEIFDWLNKKMFDYRGLIDRGLAIAVTKENNPYK